MRLDFTKLLGFGMGFMLGLVMITILASSACAPSATSTTTTTTTSTAPFPPKITYTVFVMTNNALGDYLVDSRGMTLYINSKDSFNTSTVTGSTLNNWPVFYTSNLTIPSTIKSSDFTTITRTDGNKQTAYKGWPLYYYFGDKSTGDVLGNGINNQWLIVNPGLAAAPSPKT
jgi:predicted lipoprotein with Yx(FWY)xxD motif